MLSAISCKNKLVALYRSFFWLCISFCCCPNCVDIYYCIVIFIFNFSFSGDFVKGTDALPKAQNVNMLTTDDPSNANWYPETPFQYPTHPYHHQTRPNQPNFLLPVPPPQYDAASWRAPPPQAMQQTPEGAMWYAPGPPAPASHGAGPYRPTGPPNTYPIDPFVYYPPPPHYRPPNTESAPRAHMPPPHNPFMMPAHPVNMPARPGPHAPYPPVPPVSHDGGYFGPPRAGFYGNHGHNHNRSNYNNNNNNQQGILNQGQNQSLRPMMGSDAAPKQYKVLLKHKEEEKKDEKQLESKVMTRGLEHSSEHSENSQIRKSTTLIQKIEGLNSKARTLESSHTGIKEEKQRPVDGILGTPSGVSEAAGKSSHMRTGEEVGSVQQHHMERRSNEQRRMRQRPLQVPNQVMLVKDKTVLDYSVAGSDKPPSLPKEGDDGTSEANPPSSDPAEYEIQRALLKEKAAQRAKELQKEEEERTREQRAKALAKLEELDRRATTQKEPIPIESDPSQLIDESHLQQEPSEVIITETHQQEVPLKSAEISGIATVTLSFGTISEVQITKGQVTHISEVPISSMKSSADVGVIAVSGTLDTGSVVNIGAGPVVGAGSGTVTGASSHARHHHGKQMGYKKRHNNSINASQQLAIVEKTAHEAAVMENSTELLKQTDAQESASESTQHRDDTVAHHRKRGNRNSRSKNKTEVPLPVTASAPAPVSSAPVEDRAGNEPNERIETCASAAPTSEKPNTVPPEDSGKEVAKPLEVESRTSGGNNRAGSHWKAHQQRRSVRNHRTISEKAHNETVMWAPVKHLKEENVLATGTGPVVAAPKLDGEMHTVIKTKRAEMERYVPKPQLSQLDKKPDESTDVNTRENLPPPEAKVGEVNNSNNTNNLNKSMRRGGKPHVSWRQRVGPVEMHETHNTDDGEKHLPSETQLVASSSAPKEHEDSNIDGRSRRHNGHKFYKATGSNYTGHSGTRSEKENISETFDGATTGTVFSSENLESGSCEVLNYSTNTRSQHWKPKSQSHVYSHGRGNSGWQKVVSDKTGPSTDKSQDEDRTVTSTAAEEPGSTYHRGNPRQYKSGTSGDREVNGDFQPVVGSYQRLNGEDRLEGGTRVATGSRSRGRGRNAHFARQGSE